MHDANRTQDRYAKIDRRHKETRLITTTEVGIEEEEACRHCRGSDAVPYAVIVCSYIAFLCCFRVAVEMESVSALQAVSGYMHDRSQKKI